jgi:hypothetical protein
MRRIGLFLGALVSASALAACGSGSSGGSKPSTGGSSSPGASAAFDKTAAQAKARSAVLTLSDMPAGWTQSPSSNSAADDAAVNSALARCLGVPASIFAKQGPDKVEVDSQDFASPNNGASGSVSETVDVETTSEITQEFTVVSSPKLVGCMRSVYSPFLKQKFAQDAQTKNAKIGTISAVRATIPSYGDQSAGIELTVPFSIAGHNAKVVIDFVFVRVGDLAAMLSFENVFKPFDSATAASITQKATAKLTAAAHS